MSLSREELEKAFKNAKELNDFVNSVLEKKNIQVKDIVQMDHYGDTYIFGVKVNKENIIKEEIIEIVKSTSPENYEKHIDFYGEWPCTIPYLDYYEKIIENNTKRMIETMIYYGIATQKEDIEFVIRQFCNYIQKEDCDKLILKFPDEHPIRKSYQNVSNIGFRQALLVAFVKMAMWQITNKVTEWDFIDSEETVITFIKDINNFNPYEIKRFIKENEEILEQEPNQYNYLFLVFYKMYEYIYKNGLQDYKKEKLFKHYKDEI